VPFRSMAVDDVPSVTVIVASRKFVKFASPSVQVNAEPLLALVTIVGLAM
jgi:hypothetical protein